MTKAIAAVQHGEAFVLVNRNPTKELHRPSSALRSYVLEVASGALRINWGYAIPFFTNNSQASFTATANELFESFFVVSQLRRALNEEEHRSTFRSYGTAPQRANLKWTAAMRSNKQVPFDVCIISNKTRCHSSEHKKTGSNMYKRFARQYLAGEVGDYEYDESKEEESEDE